MLSYQSTGAGIYVNIGDGSVPTGPLPNNSIVIARDVTSGDRILFQCRSGSTMTGVGQLVDLDGNTFNIGENSGVFSVEQTGGGYSHPGSVQFRNSAYYVPALTADDEGVYSCRIPDETGNAVDVNIGVYQNGFDGKFSYACKLKGIIEIHTFVNILCLQKHTISPIVT